MYSWSKYCYSDSMRILPFLLNNSDYTLGNKMTCFVYLNILPLFPIIISGSRKDALCIVYSGWTFVYICLLYETHFLNLFLNILNNFLMWYITVQYKYKRACTLYPPYSFRCTISSRHIPCTIWLCILHAKVKVTYKCLIQMNNSLM